MIRGVRGATTVPRNSTRAILDGTRELLLAMVDANGIDEAEVASVLFTTTHDLTAEHPAKAARLIGWTRTALLGFAEADIEDGLEHCIRVLIHWNTDTPIDDIQHIFLHDAISLRPDLAPPSEGSR